jgi:hypothetical protein
MANPRKTVDFTDIGREPASYLYDGVTITYDRTLRGGSSVVGKAVTVGANRTVALCADGDPVEGILEVVEADGVCTVKYDGYGVLPGGAAATLTRGRKFVGAVGAGGAGDKGYIRVAASAGDALVARGAIVDNADATAVIVRL